MEILLKEKKDVLNVFFKYKNFAVKSGQTDQRVIRILIKGFLIGLADLVTNLIMNHFEMIIHYLLILFLI